jgi:hypothetical protein
MDRYSVDFIMSTPSGNSLMRLDFSATTSTLRAEQSDLNYMI